MPTSRKQEYAAAMQMLREICAEHNIKENEKLREVFWEGVQHGWKRAISRRKQAEAEVARPARVVNTAERTMADSGVDTSSSTADTAPKRARDLSRAGLFRI